MRRAYFEALHVARHRVAFGQHVTGMPLARRQRAAKQRTSNTLSAMPISIHQGYLPGAIGRIAALHAHFYHRHAGFGVAFEAKVARELAGFCERYDSARDGLWLALRDAPGDDAGADARASAGPSRIEGGIVIDGPRTGPDCDDHEPGSAHLRWFITSDQTRGSGAGTALLNAALTFCRVQSYARVYLWTFVGLHAARHLYEKAGFRLTRQQRGTQWGTEVNEQRFELNTSV